MIVIILISLLLLILLFIISHNISKNKSDSYFINDEQKDSNSELLDEEL